MVQVEVVMVSEVEVEVEVFKRDLENISTCNV